jgi:glycosyltransferase involved in cell wall biosynthesis
MRIFIPSAADLLTDHVAHGEALIAWSLLTGLAERGHELVVCAPLVDIAGECPFEVVQLDRGRFESVAPLRYARAAERELRRRGPFDIVHWLFPQDARAAIFVPPSRTPYVIGPHFTAWPATARGAKPGDLVRGLLAPISAERRRRALSSAGALLLATPDALPSANGNARLSPPGTTVAEASPPPGARHVLFVGRLEPEKQVLALVEAFAEVRAALPDATLALAGDGPLREALSRDGVRVLGRVAHREIPALLAQCDLLCVPSLGEPYGMALLEAMAAGRAVVAGPGPGPAFLVDEHGGRIVEPHSLASTLIELLSDPGLTARMGAHNRARVERELSRDRWLDSVETVYREVTA